MKKDSWRYKFVILISGMVMIISGCSLLPVEEEPLVPPLIEPMREKHLSSEIKLQDIAKEVKGKGYFEAYDIVQSIYTGSPARVVNFNVRPGDVVKKGDVLVEFEMGNFDIDILNREIDVEKAKSNYLLALQEGNERAIKLRQLELDLANTLYERVKEQIEGRTLRAEMDGVVIFTEPYKHNDIVHDQRVLVRIADPEKLRLFITMTNPADIADVQVGMEAKVTLRGKTYAATVVQTPSTAPSTDDHNLQQKYSRTIYVEFPEIPEGVTNGESADIVITMEERKNVVVIPRMGLRTYQSRNYVHILDGETRREVDIEIGIQTPTWIEVVDGLEAGQFIILP